MKIYFAGSIRGGRDDAEVYYQIIKYLSKYGEVLTEHIGNKEISEQGENSNSDQYIYDRDIKWLSSADAVVAEATNPSLGVGFEIAKASGENKRVLCLYRKEENKRLSAMIAGCPEVESREYSDINEVEKLIDDFFNKS